MGEIAQAVGAVLGIFKSTIGIALGAWLTEGTMTIRESVGTSTIPYGSAGAMPLACL